MTKKQKSLIDRQFKRSGSIVEKIMFDRLRSRALGQIPDLKQGTRMRRHLRKMIQCIEKVKKVK